MDSEKIINYHLYVDECGDQNLEAFSPTFPIFTLCGILVRDDLVPQLEGQVRALKQEFWGNRQIILHSRDIRKCQNGFEVLFDLDVKRRFYESINQLLGQRGVYVIVSCSILKEPYIRQFGRFNDVYGQSLSFVLERAIFCVDNQCPDGQGRISAIVERRGKREDKNLKLLSATSGQRHLLGHCRTNEESHDLPRFQMEVRRHFWFADCRLDSLPTDSPRSESTSSQSGL